MVFVGLFPGRVCCSTAILSRTLYCGGLRPLLQPSLQWASRYYRDLARPCLSRSSRLRPPYSMRAIRASIGEPWHDGSVLALIALVFGVLAISQFRDLRQESFGTATTSLRDTTDLLGQVWGQTRQAAVSEQTDYVLDRLLERFNSIELLGVTLTRADSLKHAESVAGISNNIVNEFLVGFIPRPLWPDKPTVGDFGLWFSRLYLDIDYLTSNAPSVFGDLYRNWGFLGIPIGMFVLGVYLRVIYESLIARGIRNPSPRCCILSSTEPSVGKEPFSSIFPNILRSLFSFTLFVLLLVSLGGVASFQRRSKRYPGTVARE